MNEHTSESLEALATRRNQLQEHLQETTAKIVAVIAKDAPRFVEREARWRWLQHLDFAEGMSADDVASFKARLAALGKSVKTDLASAFAEDDAWLSPTDVPPADQSKVLEHNTVVWNRLQSAAKALAAVLDEWNFPADPDASDVAYRLVYQTPVYFLDGVYCPSLIETYWSQLGELLEIDETLSTNQATTRRTALEDKWNSA